MHLLNTLPQRLDPGATPTFAGLIAPSLTSPASTNLTLTSGLVGTNRVNFPDTLSASSATAGAVTIGNGTAATNVAIGGGKVNIGDTTAGSSNAGALIVQGGISAGNTGAASYFGGSIRFPSDTGIISSVNDGRLFLDGSANREGGSINLYGSAGAFPAQTIYTAATHIYKNISGTQQLSLSLTDATFAGAVAIGNTVNTVSPTSPNRTVTMVVNGVTLYLAAKTTND